MKRPSFQFYPADWRNNAKLRRCSFAERGIWIEVMSLFHDSDDYGILRWPLRDIAQAIGCRLGELQAIARKQVLKGADVGQVCPAFVYTPRHAGKDGEPVVLILEQPGPIWYSSRMVVDEYRRNHAGASTRFRKQPEDTRLDTTPAARLEPRQRQGGPPSPRKGDGATSSSSSSELQTLSPGGFERFWVAWPKGPRKESKSKCEALWAKKRLEAKVDTIVSHIEAMKATDQWRNGYVPAPIVYLKDERWDGAEVHSIDEKRMVL